MSNWKKHSGNSIGRNALFNNLNYNNGIFKYVNNKLIHKNPNNKTIVGIGTLEPFSKLSFGDFNKNKLDDYTFALHENESEKVGIKLFNNSGDLTYKNGLKLFASNDKGLIITDEDKYFINENPFDSYHTINIRGSLKTSNIITIGDTVDENSPNGSLRYKSDINKIQIKVKDIEWTNILLESGSDTQWNSIKNGIYKKSNVFITDDSYMISELKHSLSIYGNCVIGSNNLNKSIASNDGILVITKNISLGNIPNNHNPKAFIQIVTNNNKKPLMICGTNNNINDSNNNSIIIGSNNTSTTTVNENFIYGSGNTFKSNNLLVMGNDNNIHEDTNKSYVFGNTNKINGTFNFINGDENNINSYIESTNNKTIQNIVVGYNNNICDKENVNDGDYSDTFDNLSTPNGVIFGNNNNILSNSNALDYSVGDVEKNKFRNKKIKGYMMGISNTIQGKNIDSSCFILGDNNKCYDSGIVLGDGNTLGDKTISSNNMNSFLIGNNLSNTKPWTHCGWGSYNKLPNVSQAENQPPILFTVGQGPLDKDGNKIDFDKDSTFSVDVSGNVRCNNMIMKNPHGGLLSARIIDADNFSVGGNEFDGANDYVINIIIPTYNVFPGNKWKKYIYVPYDGYIHKIISVLNLPHIKHTTDTITLNDKVTIDISFYDDKDSKWTNTQIQHDKIENGGSEKKKDVVTNIEQSIKINSYPKPSESKETVYIRNPDHDPTNFSPRSIMIETNTFQNGYGSEYNHLLYSDITIIVRKFNNL
jgi:hypothetical protein